MAKKSYRTSREKEAEAILRRLNESVRLGIKRLEGERGEMIQHTIDAQQYEAERYDPNDPVYKMRFVG